MRYVSIDIETTGLDPEKCQILEFAAVIEDTLHPEIPVNQLPTFQRILTHSEIHGEPFGIAMNHQLIDIIAKRPAGLDYCAPQNLVPHFWTFLTDNKFPSHDHCIQFVATGKNIAGFDLRFLERCDQWGDIVRPHHRVLDPGTLYFDPKTDAVPPSSDVCLGRAGFSNIVVHRALPDAQMVIRLFRNKWNGVG